MHVLVLYESRRGFTLKVARVIRDEIRATGEQATCCAFEIVDTGHVNRVLPALADARAAA